MGFVKLRPNLTSWPVCSRLQPLLKYRDVFSGSHRIDFRIQFKEVACASPITGRLYCKSSKLHCVNVGFTNFVVTQVVWRSGKILNPKLLQTQGDKVHGNICYFLFCPLFFSVQVPFIRQIRSSHFSGRIHILDTEYVPRTHTHRGQKCQHVFGQS